MSLNRCSWSEIMRECKKIMERDSFIFTESSFDEENCKFNEDEK